MTQAGAGWRYGLLAMALAFVALPLYVHLPNHYAREFGLPLGALGGVLFGARLVDACLDPWIGSACDRLLSRGDAFVRRAAAVPAALMLAGFACLVFPPRLGTPALLAWAAFWLVVTYVGYSAVTIAHQGWGALLALDDRRRAIFFAWREGFALGGVLLALTLPVAAGWGPATVSLAVALGAGCFAWSVLAMPLRAVRVTHSHWLAPFGDAAFRKLVTVYVLNGVASAVPATLVLFFMQDRLGATQVWQPLLLGAYFAAGAASMPLWSKCIGRLGLARSWLLGMLLAVAGFAFAGTLGDGDGLAFLGVCIVSGAALGSDLVVPQAMLARVIERGEGDGAGLNFGWWNLAAKFNLALAAGLALPLLAWLGYSPGVRTPAGLHALSIAYVAVPSVLKLAAAVLLYRSFIRTESPP